MISKCCNVMQSFSKWVSCIWTQVSLTILGILKRSMNSYIYEIKIMEKNILPLLLNKILFFLTSKVSEKKINCCNLGDKKFWDRKKTKPTKMTNKKKKILIIIFFIVHYTMIFNFGIQLN